MQTEDNKPALTDSVHANQQAHPQNFVPARLPWYKRGAIALFWLGCAVYIPLSVLLIALKWAVIPSLNQYKPDVEFQLSQMLGQPVVIERFSGSWTRLNPRLSIQGLRVGDAAAPTFSLSSLRADVSLLGLLTFNPRLSNLELISPDLQVNRNAEGYWVLAGYELKPDGSTDNPALDALLDQNRIFIKSGKVRISDELKVIPDTVLDHTEVLIDNSFNHHRMGFQTRAERWSAQPITAQADFTTPLLELKNGSIKQWKGRAYAQLKGLDGNLLDNWLRHVPYDIRANRPALDVWVDFDHGLLTEVTANVSVDELELKLNNPIVDLQLKNLESKVKLSDFDHLFQPGLIALEDLSADMPGRRRFGPTSFAVGRKVGDKRTNWLVGIKDLDVGMAREIAGDIVPLMGRAEWTDLVKQLAASGTIPAAKLTWATHQEAEGQKIQGLDTDVVFKNLNLTLNEKLSGGLSKVTGFKGLTGQFKGDQNRGDWELSSGESELYLPELFASESIRLDKLSGKGQWSNLFDSKQPLSLQFGHLRISNADVEAEVVGTYEFHRKESDRIDLKGRITRAEVSRIPAYLPKVVGEGARTWLASNLKGGQAKDGGLILQGPLASFPFVGQQASKGKFKVEVPVSQGQLTFAEGWPAIQNIQGKVVFEGAGLQVLANTASTGTVALKDVSARIENLDAWEPLLQISGMANGPLGQMFAYVNSSPLSEMLNGVLSDAEGDGVADLKLKLDIPLVKAQATQVQGEVLLKGNALRLVRGMPRITALEGAVKFSEKGIQIDRLSGLALGGPIQIKGATDPSGKMEFKANGTARPAGLAQYLSPTIEQYLTGSTPFQVSVIAKPARLDVEINSTLQGLAVKLPAPFTKSAESRLPLRLTQQVSNNQERWAADLGTEGQWAAQLRALVKFAGERSQLDSLQFAMGSPLPVPAAGIQGEIRMGEFDAQLWRSVAGEISGIGRSTPLPSGTLLADMFQGAGAEGPPRSRIRIRADQLKVGDKTFDQVAVLARTVEKTWQFDVKSREVDGYFSYVTDALRPEGAVLGRFKSLAIPKSLDSGLKEIVEEPASTIPALDIQVDDFSLNDLKLGRLKLIAVNQTRDEVAKATQDKKPREWRLQDLTIENPESVIRANGLWKYGQTAPTRQITDIDLHLTVKDAGALFSRFGMAGVFKGGTGELKGKLAWEDAPTSIDYGTLSGQFKLNSKNGQFVRADPGVAKLLGVLSLQSIPRRLTLDFKDLFSQGFAYDNIEADVEMNKGVAKTSNLKMTGPSATVLMDGAIDLKSETQNLNVLVLPDLNATGGSLVYSLIAANPAVGIASLIADFVLKDPISKIFSVQYKVSGTWGEPVVDRVTNNKAKE